MMKKKIIAAALLTALVVTTSACTMFKKDNASKSASSANTKQLEFEVKSAFADVDADMVIENKDSEDSDKKHDYIFVTFTSPIADTKKDDASNPINVRSYTFDNNSLPKGTEIAAGDVNQVVIKLPNEYLKGVNAPHSLKISKDLKDKNGQSIKGTLDIKLPYSFTASSASDKQTTNNSSDKSGNTTNTQKDSDKKNSSTNTNAADNKSASNEGMPKFSVKIINNIPQTTIVAVTLESTTPQNYKVSVAGTALEMKKNNKGEQVFVGSVDKEYSFDEVNKLIKVEKSK